MRAPRVKNPGDQGERLGFPTGERTNVADVRFERDTTITNFTWNGIIGGRWIVTRAYGRRGTRKRNIRVILIRSFEDGLSTLAGAAKRRREGHYALAGESIN